MNYRVDKYGNKLSALGFGCMRFQRKNGKVDMEDMLGNTSGQLSNADLRYFGNQCANGAHVGWQRVINSVSKTHTAGMTKSNGYIPLGTYKYDTSKVTSWSGRSGSGGRSPPQAVITSSGVTAWGSRDRAIRLAEVV